MWVGEGAGGGAVQARGRPHVKPMSGWGEHHLAKETWFPNLCTLESPGEPQKIPMPGPHL